MHCIIPGKPTGVIGASRALHSPRSKWPALYLSGGEKQICASSLAAMRSTQWLFRLSKQGRRFNEPADTILFLSLLLSLFISLPFPIFFSCLFDDTLISHSATFDIYVVRKIGTRSDRFSFSFFPPYLYSLFLHSGLTNPFHAALRSRYLYVI